MGLSNCVRQSGGTEGWLFKTLGILHTQRTGHGIIERPAVAAFLAVNDRQIVTLLGFEIIAFVGIEGVEYRPLMMADALGNIINNGLRFFGAERAIDEIILHINDDEKIVGGKHRM